MINKLKKLFLKNKIIFTIFLLILFICIIYIIFNNRKSDNTELVFESIKRGEIVTNITGVGQVESSSQISINAKTSGTVKSVGVKDGQEVTKGQFIASVDCRDAKISLENAKISLEKLTTPDELSLLKSENSLKKSYDDGWKNIVSFVSDIKTIVEEIEILYQNEGLFSYGNIYSLGSSGRDSVDAAEISFYKARSSFKDLDKKFTSMDMSSGDESLVEIIILSYETSKIVSESIKNIQVAFNYIADSKNNVDPSFVSENKNKIDGWSNKVNNYVGSILSNLNSIEENIKSLENLENGGASDLDIRSSKLSLQSKQDSYNDCFTYAPFDGIITNFKVNVGEPSGSSYGTLITKQKIAVVSFNEIDVAEIEVGQNAELTFDAIPSLVISGVVAEISHVGVVSSGVVTYDVKIAFKEDDERVKSAMSVNVDIITNYKKDILIVSSMAVKTRNKQSYVEVVDKNNGQIIRKNIEIGISNDTFIEIVSGLEENEQILLRTINKNDSISTNVSGNGTNNRAGGIPMGGSAMSPMMR